MIDIRKLSRAIRRFVRVCMRRDVYFRLDARIPSERFGSDYGGWSISTDKLTAQSVIYSFGIGEDASFDLALIDRFGVTVHAFDPTPKSIAWVKRQKLPANFKLHEFGVAGDDGEVVFYLPDNPSHVSSTMLDRAGQVGRTFKAPVKRLETITRELGHHRIDVLKMDIEGAEYGVVKDMSQSNIRPAQLLIEFHHRFPGMGIHKTSQAVDMIRNMGYSLFSISPSGEELSFIRLPQ